MKFLELLALIAFVFGMSQMADACTPRDDSDTAAARSGMDIHTDARTGCQYFSRMLALTPRLDREGRQICETPTKGSK